MENNISERLLQLQDLKYKDFQCKLMPTVPVHKVIGVRTPVLRAFAKEIKGSCVAEDFLKELPHKYYEEDNLHGFLIEYIKDFDKCIEELDKFLPYVDNWATCDSMTPKVLKKNPDKLLVKVDEWLASNRTYTVRYGIKMLMNFYLDEEFDVKYLEKAAAVIMEDYYVQMMVAWYFATALAKQYEDTLPFIEKKRLPVWTHNKTIQKAVESYRISDEQKEYLRTYKI
ncbi:MAG: DNA alkylation repair protein [Lachnospiraceae bacterium]|nr:DNA alkylation repair protein [Lachnospiraceae bacterium]